MGLMRGVSESTGFGGPSDWWFPVAGAQQPSLFVGEFCGLHHGHDRPGQGDRGDPGRSSVDSVPGLPVASSATRDQQQRQPADQHVGADSGLEAWNTGRNSSPEFNSRKPRSAVSRFLWPSATSAGDGC